MGSKAIPLPLQTAESGTLRAHLHTVALPETSHPWQGAHSAHSQGANIVDVVALSFVHVSMFSQCLAVV